MSRKRLKEMLKREVESRIDSYSSKSSKLDDDKPLVKTSLKTELLGKPQEETKPKKDTIKDVPSKDIPSKDIPSKDVPSKDVPSKDVPSKDVPSKDVSPKDVPSTKKEENIRYILDSEESDYSYSSESDEESDKDLNKYKYSEDEDEDEDYYKHYKRNKYEDDKPQRRQRDDDYKEPVRKQKYEDDKPQRRHRDDDYEEPVRKQKYEDDKPQRRQRDDDYKEPVRKQKYDDDKPQRRQRDDDYEEPVRKQKYEDDKPQRRQRDDDREEKRKDEYRDDGDKLFSEIPKKSFLQLIKSRNVSNISGDCVDELRDCLIEFLKYMFEQFSDPDEVVMAEASDVKTYMSFYLEDEDKELPQELCIPTRDMEKGILNICDRFRVRIRKDVIYLVHMFAECILLKVVKGAVMINDIGKTKRLSGKEIKTAYKIYMM